MIQYLYLGRIGYDEALRLQEELVDLRYRGRIGNTLLLLEHPPVLTLGRNANRSNVLASNELLAARGVTLHQINRGGDVTYHGPGQLVGYPIFDLRSLRSASGGRLGPVDFVRQLEEVLIRVCGEFGVPAARIAGLTGVWCGVACSRPLDESRERSENDIASQGTTSVVPSTTPKSLGASANALQHERKIGAIGIHVSRGITSHGFAFNVSTDLRDFQLINPCGITDKPVTSMQVEIARETANQAEIPNLEALAHRAAHHFSQVFHQPIVKIEGLDALRHQAATAPEPLSAAEDTPLTIPPELERLRGAAAHPSQA
jgi:lipoyl(octanoyl) transferase